MGWLFLSIFWHRYKMFIGLRHFSACKTENYLHYSQKWNLRKPEDLWRPRFKFWWGHKHEYELSCLSLVSIYVLHKITTLFWHDRRFSLKRSRTIAGSCRSESWCIGRALNDGLVQFQSALWLAQASAITPLFFRNIKFTQYFLKRGKMNKNYIITNFNLAINTLHDEQTHLLFGRVETKNKNSVR